MDIRFPSLRIATLLGAGLSLLHAGEVTIEPQPFSVDHEISAALLPEKPVLLRTDAEEWTEFKIKEILPHGSEVKKGDKLIAFETENFDRKLEDLRHGAELRKLSLDRLNDELTGLEKGNALRLELAKRKVKQAEENLTYFNKIRRASSEETVVMEVKQAQQRLSNAQEELKQLKKMYEDDNLTESTEEIILQRQQDQVESAEFNTRMEKLGKDFTHETKLPRELLGLETETVNAKLELEQLEPSLPRSVSTKKLEIAAAQREAARADADFKKLESDRKKMEVAAPDNGWLFYGPIEDGRWIPGEWPKFLRQSIAVPAERNYATFIPKNSTLVLRSAVDEGTARQLATGLNAEATPSGRSDLSFPAKLTTLAAVPDVEGRYAASFSVTLPDEPSFKPGMSLNVRLTSYQKESAIAVPAAALKRQPEGKWGVEVKLADGKSETRTVTRGRTSKDKVEITSGLEKGQVIIVP